MPKTFLSGRKVFFLYPPDVIQDDVIETIIAAEYEVYLLHDHRSLLRLLPKHNTSIVFANIDAEVMDEASWERFIRTIMTGPETHGSVSVGILTYNDNRVLAEKYLMEIGVQCGYVKLSLGVREATAILLKTLEVNEAKGRRKKVRARCSDATQASFNVKIRDHLKTGRIRDISSAGMACVFDEPVLLKLRDVVPDIQLRLRSSLCMVSGLVAAIRNDSKTEYVILFGGKQPQRSISRIRGFIHSTLHQEILREMASAHK